MLRRVSASHESLGSGPISATFAWMFGVIGLLRGSFMGLLILILAGVLTYMSITNTRDRRHRELLEATRNKDDEGVVP